jgi:hypothetical protein
MKEECINRRVFRIKCRLANPMVRFKRLLVKLIDEARLADFGKDGIVNERLGLRGLGSGMGREIEHRLHGCGRDQRQSLPRRQKRLVGILQVGGVSGLGVFADDLFSLGRVRAGELDAFEVGL